MTGRTELKGLGITDGDSIKLHGAPAMDKQDPAKEQRRKNNEDKLTVEEKN